MSLGSSPGSGPMALPASVPRTRRFSTEEFAQRLREEVDSATCEVMMRVPRPLGRRQVILHLFSGRRRFGGHPRGGVILQALHVILRDLVFHEHKWIAGLLAGPPCSTWSQARGCHIEGRKRQPRIIRAAESPWGIDSLSRRFIGLLCRASDL